MERGRWECGKVQVGRGEDGKMIRGRCRWEGGKERQNVDAKCVKQMKDGDGEGGKVQVVLRGEDGKMIRGRCRWEGGKKMGRWEGASKQAAHRGTLFHTSTLRKSSAEWCRWSGWW